MSQVATASLDIPEIAGQYVYLPVAPNTQIWAGELIAVVLATGFATFAQDAAGQVVVGRAEYDVNNTTDNTGGALSVKVKRGVFKYYNAASGGFTSTTPTGAPAYVSDDQTVAASGTTHAVLAGTFVYLDADGGVWVDTRRAGELGANVTLTQNSITDNSTGTAAAAVSGVRTIAAVSSVGTAANAIADLAAELNLVKADLATLKALL